MVGFLMTLLAPHSLAQVAGVSVPIVAQPQPQFSFQDLSSHAAAEAHKGENLLARWCRHLSFPCDQDRRHCMTFEEAAEVVAAGEADRCAQLRAMKGDAAEANLQQVVHHLLSVNGSFAAVSTDGVA
eukprot:5597712-Amphidinium_carterae.1